jgi:hypothetical protein
MLVRVAGAELTEPYALLLADNLADDLLIEAEAIKAQAAARAPESQTGSPKPLAAGCSNIVKMAGMAGKSSKSPWALIRRLHEERYGPRTG